MKSGKEREEGGRERKRHVEKRGRRGKKKKKGKRERGVEKVDRVIVKGERAKQSHFGGEYNAQSESCPTQGLGV